MALPGLSQINNLVASNIPNNASGLLSGPITLGSILNSLNNYQEIANGVNKTWSGPDPLLSNFFIFQPPLRNGNYIPAAFVKKMILPERKLEVDHYLFRGSKIAYVKGIDVGNCEVTFWENQELQISSFFEAWKAYGAAPGGSFYGLNNNLKFNMFFVYNSSEGISNNTAIGQIMNQFLPSGLLNTLNNINFSGIMLMIGCFPISNPMDEFHNPPDVEAQEVTVTFSVDEVLKLPISADISSIFEIAGISQGGAGLFNGIIGGASSTLNSIAEITGINLNPTQLF